MEKTIFYKHMLIWCSIVLLFGTACASGPTGGVAFLEGGNLVFSDDFEGDALDESKWNIETGTGSQYGLEGWGNHERQFYRPENVVVKNGILYLEARKDNNEKDAKKGSFPYTSGKITTGGIMNHDGKIKSLKFAMLPGDRIEARIKSPRGVGLWPAFWLIGATSNPYSGYKQLGWPRSGEIDILEIRGGTETRLNSTIHYGPYWPENRASGDYLEDTDVNLADDFHVYGVTWDFDALHFLFDGQAWLTIDLKQLNKDSKKYYIREAYGAKSGFAINMNLAVGGQYISGKIPADSVFDDKAPYEDRCLMVDWVRVFRK